MGACALLFAWLAAAALTTTASGKLTLARAMARGVKGRSLSPMRYAGIQFQNDTVRDWVEANVQPLPYAYETPLLHSWNTLWSESASDTIGSEDVVLMSQASPERLPFIRRALMLWNGPASIAVYVPFPHTDPSADECRARVVDYMASTLNLLEKRHNRSPPPFALTLLYGNVASTVVHCNLTETSDGLEAGWRNQALWQEQVQDQPYKDVYDGEYPVGTIRQLAFQLVPDNKFTFLLDADFVMPFNFATEITRARTGKLLRESKEAWYNHGQRAAVVIPAFELIPEGSAPEGQCASGLDTIDNGSECWMYSGYKVPLTKEYLTKAVKARTVFPFYEEELPNHPYFPEGHGCYSPRKALTKGKLYGFEYQHPCEPYVVALKASMPPFDERWRGRDMNKVNYLAHLAAWGTKFTVEPKYFIIHLPHNRAVPVIHAPDLPPSMDWYPHLAKEIPFVLTRVFFEDISRQRESVKRFTPWVPLNAPDPLTDNEAQEVEVMMERDRVRRRRQYKVSPWNSGLPFCIHAADVGGETNQLRQVALRTMQFDSRSGCQQVYANATSTGPPEENASVSFSSDGHKATLVTGEQYRKDAGRPTAGLDGAVTIVTFTSMVGIEASNLTMMGASFVVAWVTLPALFVCILCSSTCNAARQRQFLSEV